MYHAQIKMIVKICLRHIYEFCLQNMTNPLRIVMWALYTYTCIIIIVVVECDPAHRNATFNKTPTPSSPQHPILKNISMNIYIFV